MNSLEKSKVHAEALSKLVQEKAETLPMTMNAKVDGIKQLASFGMLVLKTCQSAEALIIAICSQGKKRTHLWFKRSGMSKSFTPTLTVRNGWPGSCVCAWKPRSITSVWPGL